MKVAIVESDYLDRWKEVRGSLPRLSHLVVMDLAEGGGSSGVLSWDDLVARGKSALEEDPELVDRSSAGVTPDNLATLVYTSGTTGIPKGVMVSQRNILWTLEALIRTLTAIPDHARLISYLPLAHVGERMASHYASIYLAGWIRFVPDLSQVAEAVGQTRPEVFFAVPRVWERFHAGLMARLEETPNARRRALALGAVNLATEVKRKQQAGGHPGLGERLKMGLFDRLVFSKIRHGLGLDDLKLAISAAAPVSPDLLLFFRGIGLPVYELYGQTESSGPGTSNWPENNKIGSVGRAMVGVEVTTADDDEILMRGGLVTQGYFRDPEGTAATFDEDGWVHTGDLGRIDEDGYLTIIGRKKDIIITAGGKNVAPAGLENIINQNGLIAQSCVIGDRRRYLTVLVSLDPEVALPWAESQGLAHDEFEAVSSSPQMIEEVGRIVQAANQQVARVEQAKKWIVATEVWSPETGELTPSLKLKRQVVLERYSEQIEEMYAD